MERFLNRRDAGKQLSQKLMKYAGRADAVVLALPRGGVPVAYEVARALKAPMDVLIVRKLGVPGQEELAFGAIASGEIRIINENLVRQLKLDPEVIDVIMQRERSELQRREGQYRGNRAAVDVRDRIVILIDDGLATGATMLAAVSAMRSQQPARIVLAVPTASQQAIRIFRSRVEEAVYVIAPEPFEGVGKWYEDFSQTTDEEVQKLLSETE